MHRHWRIIMVLAKAKAESRPRRSEEGARQKRRKERGFLAGGNLKFEIFNAPTPVALPMWYRMRGRISFQSSDTRILTSQR